MSEFRIDQITNQSGSRGPDIAGITTFTGTSGMVMPSGATEYRGGRGRGIFAGGYTPGASPFTGTRQNTIDYITIETLGNSSDFGDLTIARTISADAASSTRGLFAGGTLDTSPATQTNTIDYITISSTGNAFDFGDLLTTKGRSSGCSNNTRGVFMGGYLQSPTFTGYTGIEFVTISSLGNSSKFGDLFTGRYGASSCASPTRGIFAGGGESNPTFTGYNIIDFITISTLGNAQDFGDLLLPGGKRLLSGCSNSIRGLFAGGIESPLGSGANNNVIEYITIASTGDSIDFGDLTQARRFLQATANRTRGVFGGGYTPTPTAQGLNTIDYVNIMSTGNAQDFGDLTRLMNAGSALSDAHGGLGD